MNRIFINVNNRGAFKKFFASITTASSVPFATVIVVQWFRTILIVLYLVLCYNYIIMCTPKVFVTVDKGLLVMEVSLVRKWSNCLRSITILV